MAYTQENRLIAIDTPLDKDALLLQGFTGVEGISQPFHFTLDVLSENDAIEAADLVGEQVTIRIGLEDGTARYINGIVSRFTLCDVDARLTRYRMELVPWLWLLARTSDCRIFQNKTIPQIIEQIFKDLGVSDYKLELQASYSPREYCVQYRETDFNFVSRLMEQYGIFYFFEHEETKHTLVLADSVSAHVPCPKRAKASCEFSGGSVGDETISEWNVAHELRPAKYSHTDFNFKTPNTSLLASVDGTNSTAPTYEIYDYPGEYLTKSDGEALAKLRIQEEEASHLVVDGCSTCRGFLSGHRFELEGHYRRELNGPYVLTTVRHFASAGSAYKSGTGASDEAEGYANEFTAIPHRVPFRAARRTPTPVIQGAQTAIVVGPKGEEIHTDEYGRVRVQFHWDREGRYDEKSSCWIRVSQGWAGKRWGSFFLPRIGQEVIVRFLEGDPNQPIIVGRVYNAEQMPAYALPGEQTKSIIKTYSSKGGGGFNEIRFEDKKGSEQLFVHAQRQLDNRVEKNSLEWVGRNRHIIVEGHQLEAVKGDKHLKVSGDQCEQVNGTVSQKLGMDLQEKVGMKAAVDAGMEIHLKAAMNAVIEGGMSVTLKAGGGFVVVGPAGVTISGMPILLNSGGSAGQGSGASPQAPQAPLEADTAKPGERATPPQPATASPQAAALRQAAMEEAEEAAQQADLAGAGAEPLRREPETEPDDDIADAQADTLEAAAEDGTPFCEECEKAAGVEPVEEPGAEEPEEEGGPVAAAPTAAEREGKTFIAIELVDERGNAVPGKRYKITLPDGETVEGVLDGEGKARLDGIDPGQCTVSFPDADGREWGAA
jgi:type VI secretion system secreted protein VgrG